MPNTMAARRASSVSRLRKSGSVVPTPPLAPSPGAAGGSVRAARALRRGSAASPKSRRQSRIEEYGALIDMLEAAEVSEAVAPLPPLVPAPPSYCRTSSSGSVALSVTSPASPFAVVTARMIGFDDAVGGGGGGEGQRVLQDELLAAVAEADVPGVVAAVQRGADVALPDSLGNYCACEAVLCGAPAVLRQLIAFGADVNCKDDCGRTPLWLAAFGGFPDMLSLLLEHGAAESMGIEADGKLPIKAATSTECKRILWETDKRARFGDLSECLCV